MRCRCAPFTFVVTATLASGSLVATQAPQPFRTAANTVPVYATVTDSRGALIRNLTAEDFEIEDEGKRQPVTVFSRDAQSMTIAILLDRSPSVFGLAQRMQTAVNEFVARLLPADRASLGTFSHVVTLDPALTSDRATLLRHLADEAPFPAGTALWDALAAGHAAVAGEAGRRVVLLFTDAADNSSRSDIDDVRTALEKDGVMTYAVGVRGREGLQVRELTAMARATGGWYFEMKPDDDVAARMQQVADELHHQYAIGFTPRTLDDRMHRIEVKMKRPGFTVRARRAYFASSKTNVR
jgi:Ca-activated chloride channel family protein